MAKGESWHGRIKLRHTTSQNVVNFGLSENFVWQECQASVNLYFNIGLPFSSHLMNRRSRGVVVNYPSQAVHRQRLLFLCHTNPLGDTKLSSFLYIARTIS